MSAVTDAVHEEVSAWQSRPLESTYALVFFDALRVKIRDEGAVSNRAVHLAIGIRASGHREILGLWIEQSEGAKFWLRVMTELKARGTRDILIAGVDGLKGFPEAIESVFPETEIQTCIVHLIRYSMQFASWKERKAVARALRPVWQADTAEHAAECLDAFAQGPWGQKYPMIAQALAAPMGAGHSLFRLCCAGAQNDLYHERHRVPAQPGAKGGAHPGAFSQRPGREQADLSGAAQDRGEVDTAASGLASGPGAVCDILRRPVHRSRFMKTAHTQNFLQALLRGCKEFCVNGRVHVRQAPCLQRE